MMVSDPDPMTPGHPVMMVPDAVTSPYPTGLRRGGRRSQTPSRKPHSHHEQREGFLGSPINRRP